MFDETELKSECSLLGVMATALKINKLCNLLFQKGVITEEEIKTLNEDSAKEIVDAFTED